MNGMAIEKMDLETARQALAAVLEATPDLNSTGMGWSHLYVSKWQLDRGAAIQDTPEARAENVAACFSYVKQFAEAVAWLTTRLERTAGTDDDSPSSYGLKHVFEADTGIYICNGVFIAAAIHAGLDTAPLQQGSLNMVIGVSRTSVRHVMKKCGWLV